MRDVIICDFDETITERDTISVLGELPYAVRPNLEPQWSHFTETYMRNYRSFEKSPVSGQRRLPLLPACKVEITSHNFQTLFKNELTYQNSARKLEQSSTCEIARYGIFRGIKHSQMSQFAEQKLQEHCFSLQKGFKDFLSRIPAEQFFVVSVNWSSEFIKATIGQGLVDSRNIYCNELLSNHDTYTGEFSNQLLTGSDKVTVIDKILSEQEGLGGKTRNWYIGDSETDILALLHPKVNGILLIDPKFKEKKLRRLTTEVLGLDVSLIDRFVLSEEVGWLQCYVKNQNYSLFLAKSWFDLEHIKNSTQ